MSKPALAVLGLLAEQPRHGYEIQQTFRERHMHTWTKVSTASIYNTLIKLENENYIESETVRIGKKPERNVFTITEKGKKYLEKLVEKFLEKRTPTDYPFGLGMAFLNNADPDRVIEILEIRLEETRKMRINLSCVREEHLDTIPFNWLAVIKVGVAAWEVEEQNIEFLLKNLKGRK